MTLPSFEEFSAQAIAEHYDEVLVRGWAPGTVVDEHVHDFEASALVVQGEMWLTVGGSERRLVPGDRFHLAPNVPHLERYGDQGAIYWAARKDLTN